MGIVRITIVPSIDWVTPVAPTEMKPVPYYPFAPVLLQTLRNSTPDTNVRPCLNLDCMSEPISSVRSPRLQNYDDSALNA